MENFIMENCRNPQPGVFDQPLLDCVCKLGSFSWAFPFALSGNLADSILHDLRGLLGRHAATVSGEICLWGNLWPLLPETYELRHFLLNCHSFQKVCDALVYTQLRVLVVGRCSLGTTARRTDQDAGNCYCDDSRKNETSHLL